MRKFLLQFVFIIPAVILFFGIFGLAGISQAATRYVGAAQEYPTIQAAANVAVPGDTVLVFDGNYTGFQILNSGNSNSPITYKANGLNAVINVGGPTGDGIYIDNASYVTIDGFKIQNVSQRCIAARGATPNAPMYGLVIKNNICTNAGLEGFYLSEVNSSLVENNTITGSGVLGISRNHGLYLANAGSKNTIIRGNIISGARGTESEGIHINGDITVGGDGIVSGLTIEKNIVYNNFNNGINMDGVQSSLIQNNIVYGNGHHALRAYRIDGAQGPKNLKIINNTFLGGNNGAAVKLSEDLGGHLIFNNILLTDNTANTSIAVGNTNFSSNNNVVVDRFSTDNETTIKTLAQWQTLGYDTNSIISTVSNLFVSPSTNDYHLKSGSSAIDRGIASLSAVSAPTTDIENSIRPRGTNYDAGAYEYISGSPDTTPPAAPTGLTIQ